MRSQSAGKPSGNSRRVRALRDVLIKSGYSAAAENESILGDLFRRGIPVSRRALAHAVAPLGLADLQEMGLCVTRGDRVHPTVSLDTYDGLTFAGDLPGGRRDHVGSVSRAGITLTRLTVRKEAGAALDLGTGCGLQALLSANHSTRVTATDVNPRALRYAAFNAALNGIGNVQLVQGSWLRPVRGQKFDLIVANPPYVISPDSTFVYRDSGKPGDLVSRRLVREIPSHLAENGTATILCNWVHRRDQPWSAPLAEWVCGSGCDALLLHYASDDPDEYARRWNQGLRERDTRQHEQVLRRWCAYYREQGIEAIASGAVVFRRRNAPNWVRTLAAAEAPTGPAGEQILRLFAAHDFLADHPALEARNEAFLSQAFALVEGHLVEQVLTYRSGEYANHPAIVRALPGLGAQAEIDPRAVHLLLDCDGTTTLGRIVERAAARVGIDREALAPIATSTFRKLLEHGLIEIAGAADTQPRGPLDRLPEPAGAPT